MKKRILMFLAISVCLSKVPFESYAATISDRQIYFDESKQKLNFIDEKRNVIKEIHKDYEEVKDHPKDTRFQIKKYVIREFEISKNRQYAGVIERKGIETALKNSESGEWMTLESTDTFTYYDNKGATLFEKHNDVRNIIISDNGSRILLSEGIWTPRDLSMGALDPSIRWAAIYDQNGTVLFKSSASIAQALTPNGKYALINRTCVEIDTGRTHTPPRIEETGAGVRLKPDGRCIIDKALREHDENGKQKRKILYEYKFSLDKNP